MAVTPFIGRRPQLDLLDRCLQETIAGRPQVILIDGDAGVGKTRLLKQIQSIAPRHNSNACYGRCYEGRAFPYLPFVESLFVQLQQIPDDVQDALGPDMKIISRFLHWDNEVSLPTEQSLSAQAAQDTLRLFLALSRATIKLAQSHPQVLIVDDLQWADRSSLDLFCHLVFAVADAALREPVPLFILGAHRPVDSEEHFARSIARLRREEICQTLHLSGLSESEVDNFIQGLGVGRPAHQLIETVSEVTHGNPLFIQEVFDQLKMQGALEERYGYIVTTSSFSNLRLPTELTTAIADSIKGIKDEECRKVLTWAAFLGDSFSLPLLSAVMGVSEEKLLDLLEKEVPPRLLLNEGETFQFAHPLIRQEFYTKPLSARRRSIHLQIARTLEREYANSREGHIPEIAYHWVNAGAEAEAEKVVEYARLAGDHAFRVFAWGEAARYYEAALSAGESTGLLSSQSHGELHYLAGYAHYRDMDVGPCRDHYEKAIEAYQLSGDVRGLALVLKEKVGALFTLAAVPFGTMIDIQPLEEVLEELGENEPGLRGRLLAKIAQAYWHGRQPNKAEEVARQTLEIGRRINDDPLCAEASLALALAQTQRLHVSDALESWRNSLNFARRADDLWRQGWVLQRMPLTLSALGRLEEAETMALEACALIRQTHDWGGYALALATLVTVAVIRGDFALAEKHAREVMLMVRRSRYPWGGANALPALAGARFLRGAWAEADDAIALLVEPGRVFEEAGSAYDAVARLQHLFVQAYAGAGDAVREQLVSTTPQAARKRDPDIDSLARSCALIEIGDLIVTPTLAEQPYLALAQAMEQGVVFSRGWVFLLPRVLGVAATLKHWWDKAEMHFQGAIETATKVNARPELGRSYLDYARMLTVRNEGSDRARAREFVEKAHGIFNQLGMAPFAERAARLAETLHLSPPTAGRSSPPEDHLMEREVEILRYVVRGHTDREIADELLLRPETVGHYVSSILAKSGEKERSEISAYGTATGLSSPTLAILFTDIVNSTVMVRQLKNERAQQLFALHDRVIVDCLRQYHGSWIKHTGDGVMATFASPRNAVECTVAIQKSLRRAFAQHNHQHPDIPMRIRSGVHVGELLAKRDRPFGLAIHTARRVCDHAQADQILVSDVVHQLTAGSEIAFTDCGEFSLKGLEGLYRLYAVQWEEAVQKHG